jgi:hypothetical protein
MIDTMGSLRDDQPNMAKSSCLEITIIQSNKGKGLRVMEVGRYVTSSFSQTGTRGTFRFPRFDNILNND